MAGATQEVAQSSAEGKVQNMRYTSSKAIPLNISSIPTYFMSLKDDEGLVKQYAFVNIEDYSIVGVGNSISDAKRNYISEITSVGNKTAISSEAYLYELTGKVTRIASNVENGDTYYYLVIDDDNSKLFMASYEVSEELPITREGDKVSVSYIDDSNSIDDITKVDPKENEDAWDKLTDEEKAKLLKNIEE